MATIEQKSKLNLFTLTEAAKKVGVSTVRMYQFCQEGRIGQKFGEVWMITQDEIEEFLKIKRKPGRPKNSDNSAPPHD